MAIGSRPDWQARLQHLDRAAAAAGAETLVVSNPINIRYLTGFAGSAGLLVSGPGSRTLITDGRYDASVREAIADGTIAGVDVERVTTRYDLALAACLERRQTHRIGFEAGHVTVAMLRRWQALTGSVEWHPTEDLIERLRLIKDASEAALFRRAGALLSGVATNLKSWVTEDRTEREVASDIDRAIERAGFERPAFETIVASGPQSAYPHARPTDRRVTRGDLVVLDFGGVLDGYCVDLTRMAGIGQIGTAALDLYSAVREAHGAALRAVAPGVAGSEVDRAARAVLESRGLADAFVHGTGHGLGLEVHEAPRLARVESGARDVLDAGMVCTIEPGAYVDRLGGVRLEDDVLVTTSGYEALTDAPLDLIVV